MANVAYGNAPRERPPTKKVIIDGVHYYERYRPAKNKSGETVWHINRLVYTPKDLTKPVRTHNYTPRCKERKEQRDKLKLTNVIKRALVEWSYDTLIKLNEQIQNNPNFIIDGLRDV